MGSLAGGTDLTVRGVGFGSDVAALAVSVGGAPCAISALDLDVAQDVLFCRVAYRPTSLAEGAEAEPLPGERGARWRAGATELRLGDFSSRAWAHGVDGGSGAILEAWLEAPHTGAISFLLPRDAVGSLAWAAGTRHSPSARTAARAEECSGHHARRSHRVAQIRSRRR